MAKRKKPSKETIDELIEEAENGDIDFSLFELQDSKQLEEMNAKHAFINTVGGKSMVMCNVYAPVYDKEIIEFRTPDSIKVQYSNKSVELVSGDKIRHVELGTWWVKNSQRREYQTIIFDPAKPKEYKGCYNLWGGFSVEPKKGNWKAFKKHIWKILCNKDPVKFKYVMKWFAWAIQNPHERAEVCLVFKGEQGSGKGLVLTQFAEIFGQHGMQIAQREHLTGKFAGHLKTIVFLYADEAYYPGDKEVEGNLKNLITEARVTREAKFMDPVLDKNRLHIVMSSNNKWVIPASHDSRRFFINQIDDRYARRRATEPERKRYFTPLWAEMNNGGRAAMLYDLLNYNLRGWHPRDDVPETEELKMQQQMSLSRMEKFVLHFLENGCFPGQYMSHGYYRVNSRAFIDFVDELDNDNKKLSERAKVLAVKELGAHTGERNSKFRYINFPSLKEMRMKWDEKYPPGEWDINELWQVTKQEY